MCINRYDDNENVDDGDDDNDLQFAFCLHFLHLRYFIVFPSSSLFRYLSFDYLSLLPSTFLITRLLVCHPFIALRIEPIVCFWTWTLLGSLRPVKFPPSALVGKPAHCQSCSPLTKNIWSPAIAVLPPLAPLCLRERGRQWATVPELSKLCIVTVMGVRRREGHK